MGELIESRNPLASEQSPATRPEVNGVPHPRPGRGVLLCVTPDAAPKWIRGGKLGAKARAQALRGEPPAHVVAAEVPRTPECAQDAMNAILPAIKREFAGGPSTGMVDRYIEARRRDREAPRTIDNSAGQALDPWRLWRQAFRNEATGTPPQ